MSHDRPTPRDPQPAYSEPATGYDHERIKREATSALKRQGELMRRTGAQRGQLEERRETPRGLPAPRRETLHDGAPPPAGWTTSPSLPPPSADPKDAVLAALRRENEALRGARKPSPPSGTAAQRVESDALEPRLSDAAIGRGVRALLRRFWPLLLGAVGIGAGGAGALKPSAPPERLDAVKAQAAALKAERDADREILDRVAKRQAQLERYAGCLEDQIRDVGEQTLPAPDRMRTAQSPRPFVERCSQFKP